MSKRNFVLTVTRLILALVALSWGIGQAEAQSQTSATTPPAPCTAMRCVTPAQRKAAAANAAARRAASTTQPATQQNTSGLRALSVRKSAGTLGAQSLALTPALTLDQLYFGTHPNYANSPLPSVTINSSGVVTGVTSGTGLRKFVDQLPNIPVANPDTVTFPGSDYYEIALVQYTQKMHTDLPPTTLRGYVQVNNGTDASGANTIAPASVQYLGPIIVARRDRPVRVKFTNTLAPGSGGDLFIPVDLSVMGAGLNMNNGAPYQQNRANIHLHGGNTPWISDGTPHQWTVPKGDTAAANQRGDSAQFVPDMFFDATGKVVPVPECSVSVTTNCWPSAVPAGLSNDPGQGSLTFYYTNQQSARLMFYHDHAYGITRLNVYVGEAAGYILQDPVEQSLVANGIIPATQIPLIIQDKTFVPANATTAPVYSVAVLSPGSNYNQATTTVGFINGNCTAYPTAVPVVGNSTNGFGLVIPNGIVGITLTSAGNCSVPPDVTITDSAAVPGTGATAFASMATLAQQDPTWSWGTSNPAGPNGNGDLWFTHTYMTNQWPDNPDGSSMNPMGRWDYGMWFWPPMTLSAPGAGGLVHGSVPCPSAAIPNGTCPGFPTTLLPAADGMGKGSIASLTPEAFMDTPVVNGVAYPTVTVPAGAVRFRILNAANDRSFNLSLFQADPTATTVDGRTNTEVKMVTAAPTAGWPIYWPTDGRDGGVPDPATAGPSWIQIGNEAGFIPNPAIIPPTPVGYEYARRSITVTNVSYKGLFLGPAERADVIVDFSNFAGQTLILYNDGPAPVPAFDPRYDYYTGDPDQTGMGGAPTTLAGFGPNTRTIMQIVVQAAGTGTPANLAGLQAQLPVAFKASQPAPLVPESAYSSTYGQTLPDTFFKLQDYQKTFTPLGATAPITMTLLDKTIQELFELDYGRMNATLGTEIPLTNFTTQTTIPLGYVDPPTELLTDSANVASQPVGVLGDGTQIWKITHNGVDTHAIHFHLFNVQLLNRIGWDGTNRPPDANEIGWKETVRMNPLEIEFVALRPMSQNLPWPVPDSIRLMDVTMPENMFDPAMGLQNGLGNPATQMNAKVNFGWEYVWHCHLLGHEENDMMRPMIFQVAPPAPSNLQATLGPSAVALNWSDNSANETRWVIQEDTDPAFSNPTVTTIASTTTLAWGSAVSFSDPNKPTTTTYYRVKAVDDLTPNAALTAPFQTSAVSSAWSNVAQIGPPPVASISPTSLNFPDTLLNVTSSPLGLTLTNAAAAGSGSLAITGISIGGTNPADFAQTNNCTAPLAPGAFCTFNVTFTPTAFGARSATLTVGTTDPVNPTVTVTLNGNGLAPVMVLTPAVLAFGNQPVGTTSTPALIVTVSNQTGTAPLVINGIGVSGANAADFAQTNTCGTLPASVAPGGNCTISVTFTPAAAGPRSASLNLSVAAPATAQAIAMTGTGTVPSVTLAPPSLAFGSQLVTGTTPATATASAVQNVTLTNTGLAPLSISNIVIIGANASDFPQTNACPLAPATLAAGANCTISVAFAPTARGARAASLAVTDNAAGSPQLVALTGTGIAPVASVSLTPLSFGVQVIATTSAPQSVTLLNNGDATLAINSISIGGANPADFARVTNTGNCGTSLAPLANCTISVTFTPTAAGLRSGSIVINSSDPVNPTLTVPMSGTGTAVALSPTTLAFGNQLVNTNSASRTVTLVNAGTNSLTINGVSITPVNGANFSLNNGCGGTVRAGRSCTISVRFTPTATGNFVAALSVSTSDVGVPVATVPLTGTGTAPILSIAPPSLTFTSALNVQTTAQTVTVSNTGTGPMTIFSIAVTTSVQFNQTNNCPLNNTPLAAGASCTVSVTFLPTSWGTLTKTGLLNVNVAGPATSQTVSLTGTLILPTYSVSPASLAFATQPRNTTSPAQTVTISNTGTVPLTLTNIALGGASPNQFAQTNTCGRFPATLAAGSSCTVSVTFNPTGATGSKVAALNVNVGGGATPAQTSIPLSGRAQ